MGGQPHPHALHRLCQILPGITKPGRPSPCDRTIPLRLIRKMEETVYRPQDASKPLPCLAADVSSDGIDEKGCVHGHGEGEDI